MFGGKFEFNLGASILRYVGKAAAMKYPNCGNRTHNRDFGTWPSEDTGGAE